MILNAEQRQAAVAQPFQRVVIQVNVSFDHFRFFQRIRINGKIVVVGGDLNFSGFKLLHRMVAAMMPELEFERLAAECDARKLMSEADAEDGLPSHQAANVVHCVGARLGIAGAVGEKNAVGFQRENVFGWSLRGHDRDATTFAT